MKIQKTSRVLRLDKLKKVKRSELIRNAEILKYYDSNDYIGHVIIDYPNLEIIDDFRKK